MAITRVEQITHGVDDLAAGMKFYEDWGLPVLEKGAKGADFRLPSGQIVGVRASSDSSLPAAIEGGSTNRETIWGVDSKAGLDAIAAELSKDRDIRLDADGTIHAIDEIGLPIGFRVQQGQDPGRVSPLRAVNEVTEPGRTASPVRLAHIVFFCPPADLERATKFYGERLDFRATDKVKGLGNFMRAPGSQWHHNIFLIAVRPHAGLHHIAFDVNTINDVVNNANNMIAKGYQPATSLGRHIMGSNIFWYFKSACGALAEYSFDMDMLDDNWATRVWEEAPGAIQWHVNTEVDTPPGLK